MTKQKLVKTNKSQKAEPLIRTERSKKLVEFSFRYFDRKHPYFNLGAPRTKINNTGILEAKWFIRLFDALKEASDRTVYELEQSSVHDLHSVDPKKINLIYLSNTKRKNSISSDLINQEAELWGF